MIDWTQISIAYAPTVAALAAALIGLINHRQGTKIHMLVNSNMTAVKTDLANAMERIAKLQALVTTLFPTTVVQHVPDTLMAPIPITIPKAV